MTKSWRWLDNLLKHPIISGLVVLLVGGIAGAFWHSTREPEHVDGIEVLTQHIDDRSERFALTLGLTNNGQQSHYVTGFRLSVLEIAELKNPNCAVETRTNPADKQIPYESGGDWIVQLGATAISPGETQDMPIWVNTTGWSRFVLYAVHYSVRVQYDDSRYAPPVEGVALLQSPGYSVSLYFDSEQACFIGLSKTESTSFNLPIVERFDSLSPFKGLRWNAFAEGVRTSRD